MSYTGSESRVELTKAEMLEELEKLVKPAFVTRFYQNPFTSVQVLIYRNILGFIQSTKMDRTNWRSNSNNRFKITLEKQLPGYNKTCDYTDETCKNEWVAMMNSSFLNEEQVNEVLNKLKPKCNAANAANPDPHGSCAMMGGRRRTRTRKTKKTKTSKRSKKSKRSKRGTRRS